MEAHHLETQQEWAGISLCGSMHKWDIEEGLTENEAASILGVMEEESWLVRWPVPTKDESNPSERLAINWLNFDSNPNLHRRFTDLEEAPSDPRARAKLANTEAFYRHLSELGLRS